MKSALMIGCGIQQVEAIRQLKKEGWKVGVTDRHYNSPCKELTDYFITADGRDIEYIIQSLLLQDYTPTAVFTLTELTTSAALISTILGLPSPSIKGVVASQSKALSKLIWMKNKVSTPPGYVVSCTDDINELLDKLEYPCVTKPDISFGGQGVSLVENPSDLPNAIELSLGTSKSKRCIVEKYIEGTLYDGNGFFSLDGNFHLLSISKRTWSNKISVEGGATCPSNLSTEQQYNFSLLFEKACRSIGIEFGPVKIDTIFDGKEFFVLEVAARLHGPRNSLFLIPKCYGKALLPIVLSAMESGQWPQWHFNETKYTSYYEQIRLTQQGKISRISGINRIKKINNIFNIQLFKKVGDRITFPVNSTEVIGYIFAVGKNIYECKKAIEKAKSELKIDIEVEKE